MQGAIVSLSIHVHFGPFQSQKAFFSSIKESNMMQGAININHPLLVEVDKSYCFSAQLGDFSHFTTQGHQNMFNGVDYHISNNIWVTRNLVAVGWQAKWPPGFAIQFQCCQHRGLPAELGYFEIACRGSKIGGRVA